MSYQTVRDALETALTGITFPGLGRTATVFVDPPASFQDLPAIVLYGSEGSVDYPFGGGAFAEEHHREHVRVLLAEYKVSRGAELVRLARAAIHDALANDGNLGNGAGYITRLEWERPSTFAPESEARALFGFDLFVSFVVQSAV